MWIMDTLSCELVHCTFQRISNKLLDDSFGEANGDPSSARRIRVGRPRMSRISGKILVACNQFQTLCIFSFLVSVFWCPCHLVPNTSHIELREYLRKCKNGESRNAYFSASCPEASPKFPYSSVLILALSLGLRLLHPICDIQRKIMKASCCIFGEKKMHLLKATSAPPLRKYPLAQSGFRAIACSASFIALISLPSCKKAAARLLAKPVVSCSYRTFSISIFKTCIRLHYPVRFLRLCCMRWQP